MRNESPLPDNSSAAANTRLLTAGWIVVAASLVTIAILTLSPDRGDAAGLARRPFLLVAGGEFSTVDLFLNILLFVPLGIGLALVGVPARQAMLAAAVLSGSIETAQYLFLPGRQAALSDFLTNIAGTWLGFTAVTHGAAVVRPSPSASRLGARLAAAWWIGLLALSGWLLRPELPALPWWGQLAPTGGTPAAFQGTVIGATAGGVPIGDGPIVQPEPLLRALENPDVTVSVAAVSAGPTPALASICAIVNGMQQEAFRIAQRGDALVLRVRVRGARAHLRTPALRLDNGTGTPGDTLSIRAGWQGRTLRIVSALRGTESHADLTLQPSLGWSLLLPFDAAFAPTQARAIGDLWLALWLLPFGYFLGWSPRHGAGASAEAVVLPILTIAAGLVILPLAQGYRVSPSGEWLASLLGIGLGWVLQQAAAGAGAPRSSEISR